MIPQTTSGFTDSLWTSCGEVGGGGGSRDNSFRGCIFMEDINLTVMQQTLQQSTRVEAVNSLNTRISLLSNN